MAFIEIETMYRKATTTTTTNGQRYYPIENEVNYAKSICVVCIARVKSSMILSDG